MGLLDKIFQKPVQKIYGVTGTQVSEGVPFDEWLPDLYFPDNIIKYRKMRRQDPVIGGGMEHLEQIFVRLKWGLDGNTAEVKFFEDMFNEFPEGFSGFIYPTTSAFTYGFFLGEKVFDIKDGQVIIKDILPLSAVSIGAIDIPNNVVRQYAVQGEFEIPYTKCFHFYINHHFRNPFGVSLLRKIYKPYYYKISIEATEAVSVRYDLKGLPVIEGPPGFNASAADPTNKAEYDPRAAKTLNWVNGILQKISQSKLFGAFMPDGFKLTLVRPSGKASINTNEIINRYNTEILSGLLQGFLAGGMFASTNNANIKDQIQVFLLACNGWAQRIADAINKQIIEPLCVYNNFKNVPKFSFGPASISDLQDMASFVARLVKVGVITPTGELEQALLDMADLPLGKNEKPVENS